MKTALLPAIFLTLLAASVPVPASAQGTFPQTMAGPVGMGGNGRISYTEFVALEYSAKDGAQKVRQAIYADILKECKTLEELTKRSCRLLSVSIKAIDKNKPQKDEGGDPAGNAAKSEPAPPPDNGPSIAAVDIELELYDKPVMAAPSAGPQQPSSSSGSLTDRLFGTEKKQ